MQKINISRAAAVYRNYFIHMAFVNIFANAAACKHIVNDCFVIIADILRRTKGCCTLLSKRGVLGITLTTGQSHSRPFLTYAIDMPAAIDTTVLAVVMLF